MVSDDLFFYLFILSQVHFFSSSLPELEEELLDDEELEELELSESESESESLDEESLDDESLLLPSSFRLFFDDFFLTTTFFRFLLRLPCSCLFKSFVLESRYMYGRFPLHS